MDKFDKIEDSVSIVFVNCSFTDKNDFINKFNRLNTSKHLQFTETMPNIDTGNGQIHNPIVKQQILKSLPMSHFSDNNNNVIEYISPEKRLIITKNIDSDKKFDKILKIANLILENYNASFTGVGINFKNIYIVNDSNPQIISGVSKKLQSIIKDDNKIHAIDLTFSIKQDDILKNFVLKKALYTDKDNSEKQSYLLETNYHFSNFGNNDLPKDISDFIQNEILNKFNEYYSEFQEEADKIVSIDEGL